MIERMYWTRVYFDFLSDLSKLLIIFQVLHFSVMFLVYGSGGRTSRGLRKIRFDLWTDFFLVVDCSFIFMSLNCSSRFSDVGRCRRCLTVSSVKRYVNSNDTPLSETSGNSSLLARCLEDISTLESPFLLHRCMSHAFDKQIVSRTIGQIKKKAKAVIVGIFLCKHETSRTRRVREKLKYRIRLFRILVNARLWK